MSAIDEDWTIKAVEEFRFIMSGDRCLFDVAAASESETKLALLAPRMARMLRELGATSDGCSWCGHHDGYTHADGCNLHALLRELDALAGETK